MRLLLALLLAFPASAAASPWLDSLAQARRASAAAHEPILIDFHAVWCYSCYYMEQKVLSTDGFAKAAAGLVLLKLDVDTPEGAALQKRYRVGFLPSYLLIDERGRELGRILGEQKEADFLSKLATLTRGGAHDPAARLAAALDAGDLPRARRLRRELAKAGEPEGAPWLKATARLDLALALKAKRPDDAVKAFETLMRLGGGCELPYPFFEVQDALADVSPDARRAALETARAALTPVARQHWFGAASDRCADSRSLAEAVAAVDDALGLAQERATFLDGTVAELKRREEEAGGVGQDRNLDDDTRFFLELSGRKKELEDFLARLVPAYPSDYVYPYRYAKFLDGEHRGAEALALAEKAYRLSYGGNRFAAARLYAKLLAGAGRRPEAKALLGRELRAARAHFAGEVPPLQKALAALK